MKWLITGSRGMLAKDLTDLLRARDVSITLWDKDELDIRDPGAVDERVTGFDVVANCAAWVNAETAEEHPADVFALNSLGPANLARATARQGATLVHLSTDYVFGGGGESSPIHESTSPAPLSVYGRTKLSGEWAVRAANPQSYILRTAWLYGQKGPCFPHKIAERLMQGQSVRVVQDQVGQPTWTCDVSRLIYELVTMGAPHGIYHATSEGETSWYSFAVAVATSLGLDPSVVSPVTSNEFPTRSRRPAYSALAHTNYQSVGVQPIGEWIDRWREAAPSIISTAPSPHRG